MNYLEALPFNVHQQIAEMAGIKDSLYKVEERGDKLVLLKSSDSKNIPPFVEWKPEEILLKLTDEIKDGYINLGKNKWFSGNYKICCKWSGKIVIYDIDHESNETLVELCKAKYPGGSCDHCRETVGLLHNGEFYVDCKNVNGKLYHKKCKEICFEKADCGCYLKRHTVKPCGTCKKLYCFPHYCGEQCIECKKIVCKSLLTGHWNGRIRYLYCNDCQTICKSCGGERMGNLEYYRCHKCNAHFCDQCFDREIIKLGGEEYCFDYGCYCQNCYGTLVKACPDCEVVHHLIDFRKCEKCDRIVCQKCRVYAHEPIVNDNGEIETFWSYLVCKDCVEEKQILVCKVCDEEKQILVNILKTE